MTRQSVTIIAPPTIEPVSLEDEKLFLKVDGDEDDALITDLLQAAREEAGAYTRRAFITRSCRLTIDAPGRTRAAVEWWDGVREGYIGDLTGSYAPISLPCPPLMAVTTVTAYDTAGQPVILAADDYTVDIPGARLILRDSAALPPLRPHNALEIDYQAGYGPTPVHVPAKIRLAIKQAASAYYCARACGDLPDGAAALLKDYRVLGL